MTTNQKATVTVVAYIPEGTRPTASAGAVHVRVSDDLALVSTSEHMLAFARALVAAVEAAVPIDLLMAEWEKDAEEAVAT